MGRALWHRLAGVDRYYRLMARHIRVLLTHWSRVTHICVGNLTIIASDNGLSPGRRQAIIWTNAGILLIGPLGTNFNEILIETHTFSFKKMHLKMSSVKWRPFCLGLNVLIRINGVYGKMVHWPGQHITNPCMVAVSTTLYSAPYGLWTWFAPC